jgi:protease II
MTELNKQTIAPIEPAIDNYFGTDVVDNYRYMENFNDPVVQQWVKTQADYTIDTLSKRPERAAFLDRMRELDASVPAKVYSIMRLANGNIFYLKIEAQEDVAKLYMRSSMDSPEILLVDPDRFRQETGNIHAINEFNPSGDGKYLIYLVSANGSEDASLYALDTQTFKDIDVPISRTVESTCWLPDNRSFFYHRLQEMKEGMAAIERYQKSQTYWHRLGTDPEQDRVALQHGSAPLEDVSPTVWPCITHVSSGYAIAVIFNGTQRNIDAYVSTIDSLSQNAPKWIKICDAADEVRNFTANGEEWYRAGFQQTKPNTWKDFIACAEYLIEHKYTSPAKLAGEGVSAGGILIGRAITECPDLFAVAIARVGCLNQVRLETTPNGINNTPEFGSCETEVGFQALYEMDAFLHVRDGVNYPAMLITHGITDPRVEPWQSAKFAARVQAASASGKPVLLRMDYESGHGIGSTKTQIIQERVDIFTFMAWQFGMDIC